MGFSPLNSQLLVGKSKIGNHRDVLMSGLGLEKRDEWSF